MLALALLGLAAFAQTLVLTPNTTLLSSAGGNVTFTATLAYTTPPSTLGFNVILPTGWTYLGGTSIAGTNPPEPFITPASGRVGSLDWAFVNLPPSGTSFTFTTSYPAGVLGTQSLTSSFVARDGSGGTATTVTNAPIPLPSPTTLATWNGGTGNWTDATQWSSTTVPQNTTGLSFSAIVNGGVATLGAALTIDNLVFTGGMINGSGNLTLASTASTWGGGIFSGLGELVIAPGAQLTANGAAAHAFSERTIRNQGVFAWVDTGSLVSGTGGQFVNTATGVFHDATSVTANATISNGTGGTFTFTNAGTFLKTTASTTKVSVPFTNSGNLLVSAGTLRFSDTFTQTGGIVHVETGATAAFDNGLTFTTGVLHGGGTVAANVTNGGFLSPGDTIGRLTVQGNLTLLSTSQLLFELNTPVAGTGYDVLSVSGNVTLGGTFNFSMMPGAENSFSGTDSLTLISGNSLTGSFVGLPDGTRFNAVHGTGSFVINYTANGVVLNQFLPVPEPSTWALMLAGLAVVGCTVLRRRR